MISGLISCSPPPTIILRFLSDSYDYKLGGRINIRNNEPDVNSLELKFHPGTHPAAPELLRFFKTGIISCKDVMML